MSHGKAWSAMLRAIGGFVLVLSIVAPLHSGELRPYLPPDRRGYSSPEQQAPYGQSRGSERSQIPPEATLEVYYQSFAAKTATLPKPQREELKRKFEKQLDTARENGDWGKATHYSRLLEILSRERR